MDNHSEPKKSASLSRFLESCFYLALMLLSEAFWGIRAIYRYCLFRVLCVTKRALIAFDHNNTDNKEIHIKTKNEIKENVNFLLPLERFLDMIWMKSLFHQPILKR